MTTAKILIVVCFVLLTNGITEARQSWSRQAHGEGQPGVFDYYIMSLSWSPAYCLDHPDERTQCAVGRGYSFVLHGIWPQYRRGGYPPPCATSQALTPEARRFANTIFPSPKLVQHEWEKHGTCSALDAMSYFQLASKAYASVNIPETLSAPKRPLYLSTAQIVEDFTAANPSLSRDSLVVICNKSELAEIRLCMEKDLTPTACGKGVTHQCRSDPIRIRPIR